MDSGRLVTMVRRGMWLGCSLMVWIAVGCATTAPPPASFPSPLLGKELPSVRGNTVSGETMKPQDLQGRPVVIKFFAKYCEPCKRTLPSAQRSHVRRGDVLFVGISEDEMVSDAQQLVRAYGLTFPVIHDRDNVLSGRFRVSDLPVTFVVDRCGVVRYVLGPDHEAQVLDQVLDSMSTCGMAGP